MNIKIPFNICISWVKLCGFSLLEPCLIVVLTCLPSVLLEFSRHFGSEESFGLIALICRSFSYSDCIVLSASLLGAATINMANIGGGRSEVWTCFRKILSLVVFVVYATVIVCNCALSSKHVTCTEELMLHRSLFFFIMACIVLVLSSVWKRANFVAYVNSINPYQAENARFVERFSRIAEE